MSLDGWLPKPGGEMNIIAKFNWYRDDYLVLNTGVILCIDKGNGCDSPDEWIYREVARL